ncbi:unnamed protein product [Phytomonas sp. EM1]|nr:unnamed protein product [Phytomonas sp. EM1]|eukprot:CCW61323.1 unnamed protein product [Phytomonas sp. isolate EM1]
MSGHLLEQVPGKWAAIVRPFLQRAVEFEKQQPVVSYFLRTHVAYLCMKNRTKDKEDLKFLKQLLSDLEKDKQRLTTELENADGRTILRKYALMLFTRADDEERSGNANLNIVRLFFTSALLFEATTQFTDDGEMDSIAKEKSKYAKYTAACMKKALDSKVPYISRNGIAEAPSSDPSCSRDGRLSSRAEGGGDGGTPPPEYPAPAPFSEPSTPFSPPPAYAPPPFASPFPPAPGGGIQGTVMKNSNGVSAPVEGGSYRGEARAVGQAGAPSLDAILDAQKSVSQAVTALQFYDHANARNFLLKALEFLDQQS